MAGVSAAERGARRVTRAGKGMRLYARTVLDANKNGRLGTAGDR